MLHLLIIGAGGHGRVVREVALMDSQVERVSFLDADPALWEREVDGARVLGGDDQLSRVTSSGIDGFILGIGSLSMLLEREHLFRAAEEAGLRPVTVVHPSAVIAGSAVLGDGSYIGPGAVLVANCEVGRNAIVNTGAVVEHDCHVSDHVHLASRSCLTGGVQIGAAAHIGANAVIREGISVGKRAVVGAGSVVVKDVPDDTTVFGCPARPHQYGLSK